MINTGSKSVKTMYKMQCKVAIVKVLTDKKFERIDSYWNVNIVSSKNHLK